jgi:uncharacterized membrane protein
MDESSLCRRCGMISAVSIFLVIAIVFTLVLILRLISAFHQDEEMVEIDICDKGKTGPL